MALVKDVNSYATVAEADIFFEDRLGSEAWLEADATKRAQALVTATSLLDEMTWSGYAVSDSQALAFPRVGSYFDPRLGCDVELPTANVPARVVNATYEFALHLLTNEGIMDDTGGLESIKVGPIELKNLKSASMTPSTVLRQVNPLLKSQGGGGNLWWRAN